MCWKRYCKNSYPLEGEEIIAYNSDWIEIYAIKHIIEDKCFIPEKDLKND